MPPFPLDFSQEPNNKLKYDILHGFDITFEDPQSKPPKKDDLVRDFRDVSQHFGSLRDFRAFHF